MRKAFGRPDAATFPHVAIADRHAEAVAGAFSELLSGLGKAFTGRRAASLVGVASPAHVAGLVAPEVVAKAITESNIADLFANIATEAGTVNPAFSASFNLVRDESVAYARQQAADLVQGIDQQTKGLISDVIARGQQGDLTWSQMAAEIRPLIGLSQRDAAAALNYRAGLQAKAARAALDAKRVDASGMPTLRAGETARIDRQYQAQVGRLLKQRAVTIARTETIRAASAGEMIGWQATIDSGGADGYTVTREWSVTRDDRACPRCIRLDGMQRTTAPVGEGSRPTLANDGGFEGVPHPPLHPRCRCVIMTTMELAPIAPGKPTGTPLTYAPSSGFSPEPPAAKTFAERARADQRAVARAAIAARDDKGELIGKIGWGDAYAPGKATVKLETAVRKLGRGIDREVAARLEADGVSFDEKGYLKLKADLAKAKVKRGDYHQKVFEQEQRKRPGETYSETTRRVRLRLADDSRYQGIRAKVEGLGDQVDALRPARLEFAMARAAHTQKVLGEIRPMGGKLELKSAYAGWSGHAAGVDVEAGMDAIAGRYPSAWIAKSNGANPLSIIYEKDRAYYQPATGKVALTPEQFKKLGSNSTATHEVMHRMESTNPDVTRAEWAFIARRSGPDGVAANKGPRKLSDLGSVPYADHEIAYEDEFSNPYMGKVYRLAPDSAYEAMSMGVEGVFHGAYDMDPDYRAFVIGTLAGL